MLAFLERVGDLLEDGVIAQDEKQFKQLWRIRKGIITAAYELGHIYKANVAVPNVNEYYEVMEAINSRISGANELTESEKALVMPCGYGHMAEGDIQISIGVVGVERAELRNRVSKLVDQLIVDFVASKGGSATGEHGVGI